jgi:hypothetical protein
MENMQKVFSRIRRIWGKYVRVRYTKNTAQLRLFAVHKIVFEYAESIQTYSEIRSKYSSAYGENAKRILAYCLPRLRESF